jgi:hypothetical protein
VTSWGDWEIAHYYIRTGVNCADSAALGLRKDRRRDCEHKVADSQQSSHEKIASDHRVHTSSAAVTGAACGAVGRRVALGATSGVLPPSAAA